MRLLRTVSGSAGTRLDRDPGCCAPGGLPCQRCRVCSDPVCAVGFELPTPVSRPRDLPGPQINPRCAVSIVLVFEVSGSVLDRFLGIYSPSLTIIPYLAQLSDIFPSSSTTKQTLTFQPTINTDENAHNRVPAHILSGFLICHPVDILLQGHCPFGSQPSTRWTTTLTPPRGLRTTLYRPTRTMTRPDTEAK